MPVTENTGFGREGDDGGQTGVRGFKFTMKSNPRVLVSATKVAETTFPNCYLCASTDPTGASPLATVAFSGNTATFSPQPTLAANTTYYILAQASAGATVSYDNTFSYPVSGTHLDFVAATNGGGSDQTNNGWVFTNIITETTDKNVSTTSVNATAAVSTIVPNVSVPLTSVNAVAAVNSVNISIDIDRNVGTAGTAVVRNPNVPYGGRYAEYKRSDDKNATENVFFKSSNG